MRTLAYCKFHRSSLIPPMKRFDLPSSRLPIALVTTSLLMLLNAQNVHADNQPGLQLSANLSSLSNLTSGSNMPANLAANLPVQSSDSETTVTDLIIIETDLWSRIRNGYAIPDLENRYVNNQIAWYSTRTDYMLRTINRGSRYLFHVVEELENVACQPN